MNPRCIAAVNAAAGKPLTQAQIDKIDAAFKKTAKNLARADPVRWRGLSADQRTIEAGVEAVKALQAEAQLAKFRKTLQIVKTADTDARIKAQTDLFKGTQADGVVRDMQHTANYIAGVKNQAIGDLFDLIETVKSSQGTSLRQRAAMFLFDVENPGMTRDLALEIFSGAKGSTGNALAKKGAQAWLDVIEPLRQRFNAAGGDVGKLDYGYLPQAHDALRVLKEGRDPWAAKVLPMLDRSQYFDEAGVPMNDAAMLDMLRHAFDTISSEGQNKQTPGAFKGSGARSNAGSESRALHFKDGEQYLAYQAQFGRGSMYDAIVGHVSRMSRDIGLVERYGPNPETQMRLQIDLAKNADGSEEYVFGNKIDGYWRVLSGAAGVPQNALIARLGEVGRALQTGGKLGGAVLSSITDLGTYVVSTRYNGQSYWQAVANIGHATSKDTREFLAMHGVIAESLIGDLNRFSSEHLSTGMVSRLAQSTLKLSGLNAWTDSLRNAYSLTIMQAVAKMTRKDWTALHGFDRDLMTSRGITEADWNVMRSAQLTPHKGMDFLTAENIYATSHADASSVAAKLLGLIKDEGEVGVINPDLATKTIQTWGGQSAGTKLGELARATMQFKSFPIAMVSRHWRRMLDTSKMSSEGRPLAANPLVYGVSLGVSLMGLGAISWQAKQIAAGKDPVDMFGPHAAKFWTQAFVQGGGASILGDMILADTSQGGTGFATATAKNLLGPMIGTALDAAAVVKDNVDKKLKGQKTHTGADLVRVARSNLPFLNLWYAKAAIDHMGMHALQESMSPGYLSRMQDRARKDWGQSYWYKPGTGAPDRAPNIAAAAGGAAR